MVGYIAVTACYIFFLDTLPERNHLTRPTNPHLLEPATWGACCGGWMWLSEKCNKVLWLKKCNCRALKTAHNAPNPFPPQYHIPGVENRATGREMASPGIRPPRNGPKRPFAPCIARSSRFPAARGQGTAASTHCPGQGAAFLFCRRQSMHGEFGQACGKLLCAHVLGHMGEAQLVARKPDVPGAGPSWPCATLGADVASHSAAPSSCPSSASASSGPAPVSASPPASPSKFASNSSPSADASAALNSATLSMMALAVASFFK